jgi:hypothetical protein
MTFSLVLGSIQYETAVRRRVMEENVTPLSQWCDRQKRGLDPTALQRELDCMWAIVTPWKNTHISRSSTARTI